MTKEKRGLLQNNSKLSDIDIENVLNVIELAEKYSPDDIYLNGSSIEDSGYNDIDLTINFSSEMYDELVVDAYLDLLDSSKRIGTDPRSIEKQRVIVRGELSDTDYDIFILEENTLPSENELRLK